MSMWEIDRKAQLFIILIAAALLFAGGYKYAHFLASRNSPEAEVTVVENDVEENGAEEKGEVETLGVHVAGAVKNPGVYHLPAGARVEDAVGRAEPLPEADLNKLNLARRLVDGEKIYLPQEGEEQVPSGAAGADASVADGAGGAKVNINTASAAELDALPGLGPALSQRIIDRRTKNGPFRSVEDIKLVSGIGESRYEQLKDLICI